MRLDKFLCELHYGTRSQLKKEIRDGLVTVNGRVIRESNCQIDALRDAVCYRNILCTYEKYRYYMLNKPAGVVSATEDPKEETVLSLLAEEERKDLFPIGRLDKDTEGLLILTNDGMFSHNLLSPRKHVAKCYECTLTGAIDPKQTAALEQGVEIGEKRPTLPAKITVLEEKKILLTITEGKYHQVKRMLKAVGNEVLALKRIEMGAIKLDPELKPGEYRRLTQEEITRLQDGDSREVPKIPSAMSAVVRPSWEKIQAVIFDLDGSLVDSMWLWHAIDVEYLGRFGLETPADLQSRIEGMSFSETALFFKEWFQLPDSTEQIKEDWNRMAWDKYSNEVPLKEGALAFIRFCQNRKIKLGIATSNSRKLVENVVAVHGLRDAFDCIMTGCDVKKGKPAPDIYLAVANLLGVPPENCLVFEDILPGIQAGQAAGMKVCAVYDDYSVPQDEAKRKLADYYIHDYKELI